MQWLQSREKTISYQFILLCVFQTVSLLYSSKLILSYPLPHPFTPYYICAKASERGIIEQASLS